MFAQQNKLKELFGENGWELIETQIPDYDWLAEIWAIKSMWSPTNCYVFISFEIDPQWEDRNRKREGVSSISLSLKQPEYWQNDKINVEINDEENFRIYIKPNFEREIPKIVDSLNNLRLKFNNLSI